MSTITVWNKGRRTWDLIGADGQKHKLAPQESLEMDEAKGYKLIADYHRDFTASKMSGPSAEDLKRREQSLRDRETALKAKEEALAAREAALKAKESGEIVESPTGPNGTTMADSKPKRGRPAKAEASETAEE